MKKNKNENKSKLRSNLLSNYNENENSKNSLLKMISYADKTFKDERVKKIDAKHVISIIWITLHKKGLTKTFDQFKDKALELIHILGNDNLQKPITEIMLKNYYDKRIENINRFKINVLDKQLKNN